MALNRPKPCFESPPSNPADLLHHRTAFDTYQHLRDSNQESAPAFITTR